jgi:hypothetical protein
MSERVFAPRSVELKGGFVLESPVTAVFDLFSPLGERAWVPGWSPELLHPPGATWERGQVFRTGNDVQQAVWVVTDLDPLSQTVEYHRIEPGRYVARVSVKCFQRATEKTEVTVSYLFVGLSEAGNAEIAEMTNESFARKMEQWKRWIDGYMARKDP